MKHCRYFGVEDACIEGSRLCYMEGQEACHSHFHPCGTGSTSLHTPGFIAKVLRHNGAVRDAIHTSSIHFEYTTYTRGVNVADQFPASFSCQTRSYKWWHWVPFFLTKTTVVNIYSTRQLRYKHHIKPLLEEV